MTQRHRVPWALPEDPDQRVRIAKGYPYPAPDESYLYRDGAAHPIDGASFAGRTAVLGHGSNRSPEQLARKFGHLPGRHGEIPVTYVWLHDYDVVYSAHITAYGALASTVQAAPGCRVRVALTWLDDQQLRRMHETEGNYGYGALPGARVEAEAGPAVSGDDVTMYLSDHGCLGEAGQAVALAAVAAEGRPHRALTQEQAQEMLRRRSAPHRVLDEFILEAIADPAARWARIAHLRATALPSEVPHFRMLVARPAG